MNLHEIEYLFRSMVTKIKQKKRPLLLNEYNKIRNGFLLVAKLPYNYVIRPSICLYIRLWRFLTAEQTDLIANANFFEKLPSY